MVYRYRLYAFGSNGGSQLGLVHASDKVHIPTITHSCPQEPVRAIHGGGNHTLLLTQSGNLSTLGSNTKLRGFEDLEGDENIMFCAATWESSAYVGYDKIAGDISVQGIYTEGRAFHGELGREDANINPSPLTVKFSSRVMDLAAGMYHYAVVLEDGQVWGWGKSRNGQLGQTKERYLRTPTVIGDVPFQARRVVCGQNFTYLVGDKTTGEHMVLGDDKHGIQSKMPEHVKGWKGIGATWHAVFVLFEDGTLIAWGKSDLWELVPPNLPEIEQIAVGSDHILVLTKDGRLLSWGWSTHGNCGDTGELDPKLLVKGYVTGGYNEIQGIEGEVVKIGAGYSTSFVQTSQLHETVEASM